MKFSVLSQLLSRQLKFPIELIKPFISTYWCKMCYKGKCLYCIPVKKGCLVLAILNAIANGVLLLFCCYIWYKLNTYTPEARKAGLGTRIGAIQWGRQYKRDEIVDFVRPGWLFPEFRWIEPLILTLFSLLNLIFSALLCNGILKLRPALVITYFIYGIMMTGTMIAGFIYLLIIGKDLILIIEGLCGCALHSLFLVLVYQTRLKILNETMLHNVHNLRDVQKLISKAISNRR